MTPRKRFYLLVENRPEMQRHIVHLHLDAETELDAHREAKKWIEQHHNVYIKLIECQTVGEYAYNSVLIPENLEEGMMVVEGNDPQ